jgi:hypothetical protein
MVLEILGHGTYKFFLPNSINNFYKRMHKTKFKVDDLGRQNNVYFLCMMCRALGRGGDASSEQPAGAAGPGEERPGAGQRGEEANQEEAGQEHNKAQEVEDHGG